MSGISKRVHLVPTSFDYDRLQKALEEFAPDFVYILTNAEPIASHEDTDRLLSREIQELVKERTQCGENDIVTEGIEFYRFHEALVDLYEILYTEKVRGNEVIVNISGGTRPVAIASIFACSLTGIGQPIYYVAEEYSHEQTGASKGVMESAFSVSPLHTGPLNLEDKIPSDDEKREILVALLDRGSNSMKDILVEIGEIHEDPQQGSDQRQKIIQRYHRHGGKLVEQNLLRKHGGEYELTETGDLVGNMLEIQDEVEGSV